MCKLPQIVVTADGSHTLYVPKLNETYHSLHGAISEAVHVFILEGLNKLPTSQAISVFEMGFGTGLNALLSAFWAHNHKRKVSYHSIEAHPLPHSIWAQLNYPQLLPQAAEDWFTKMHNAPWQKPVRLNPYFLLTKLNTTIEAAQFKENSFSIVFFDAFAPAKQANVWQANVLTKIKSWMQPHSTLVSYSATGQFTRNLKALGFDVSRLPGPPGKKQMTRAIAKK